MQLYIFVNGFECVYIDNFFWTIDDFYMWDMSQYLVSAFQCLLVVLLSHLMWFVFEMLINKMIINFFCVIEPMKWLKLYR